MVAHHLPTIHQDLDLSKATIKGQDMDIMVLKATIMVPQAVTAVAVLVAITVPRAVTMVLPVVTDVPRTSIVEETMANHSMADIMRKVAAINAPLPQKEVLRHAARSSSLINTIFRRVVWQNVRRAWRTSFRISS